MNDVGWIQLRRRPFTVDEVGDPLRIDVQHPIVQPTRRRRLARVDLSSRDHENAPRRRDIAVPRTVERRRTATHNGDAHRLVPMRRVPIPHEMRLQRLDALQPGITQHPGPLAEPASTYQLSGRHPIQVIPLRWAQPRLLRPLQRRPRGRGGVDAIGHEDDQRPFLRVVAARLPLVALAVAHLPME